MNKKLLALCLAITATASFAKGGNTSESGPLVSFQEHPRVMHFSDNLHFMNAQGEITVCTVRDKYGRCDTDAAPQAWVPLSNVKIPGYVISKYNFTFSGSGGYRQLIVYFKKEQ